METKLQSSPPTLAGKRPLKWEERFFLKRIGEEDIEISLLERDAILHALNKGARFIQLRKHTIMLSALKGIDPKWGESNVPPCPKPITQYEEVNGVMISKVTNQAEIDEWYSIFSE